MEFDQATKHSTTEAMASEVHSAAAKLIGHKAAALPSEACHNLLQDIVGMWRNHGFEHMILQLQRQLHHLLLATAFHGQLHQAAPVGMLGQIPNTPRQGIQGRGDISTFLVPSTDASSLKAACDK
eukprot:Skav210900  [mRNA]  locus=scaffold2900:216959:219040:- [translate_table: standard]